MVRTLDGGTTASRKRRNLEIIRAEVEKELDLGFRHAEYEMEKLHGGLMGSVVTPLIKFVYFFAARDKIREMGHRQLNIMVKCVSGCGGTNLSEVLKRNFNEYIKHDETYIRCDRTHSKAMELEEIIWEIYRSRVEAMSVIAHGHGKSYDELVRNAMGKGDAKRLLGKNLQYTRRMLSLIETERNLLDIPAVGRSDVIKMLNISFDYAQKRLDSRIDEIFGGKKL